MKTLSLVQFFFTARKLNEFLYDLSFRNHIHMKVQFLLAVWRGNPSCGLLDLQ